MKIRTLIVDDEPLARERIRTLLADERNVEIVGECANGVKRFWRSKSKTGFSF
jgi:two-component system LytT family response regulator